MKTMHLRIWVACFALILAQLAFGQTVVITEVMYDDTASTDLEWVEIHNTTAGDIDISGWVLLDAGVYPGPGTEGLITVPATTTIAADQYLVLSKLAIPEFDGEVVCAQTGNWGLGNTGDNLALYTDNVNGILIDGSLTAFYPDLAVTNAGNSIEKCDPNAGWTSDPNAWHESTNVFATAGRYRHCTPGAENSPCAADTEPPTLVSVSVVSPSILNVTFSESLDPTTANTVTNYSVDNGIGHPTTAVLQGNQMTVQLTFSPAMPANNYNLTVNNVQDLAGNPIAPNSSLPFVIVVITEDLRFTEFMPNPNFSGLLDSLGEWFEIYNAGDSPVDLTGWILADNSGTDTIEAATINVGQYFVFCSNNDLGTNGGVPTNYGYHYGTSGWGLALNNTGETIALRNPSGLNVAATSYVGLPFSAGFSAQLRNIDDDPTVPANWCSTDQVWEGATNGDHGTPGAATICSVPVPPDTVTVCAIRQQDACGVPLLVSTRVVTRAVVSYVDTCRPIAYMQTGGCGVSIYGTAVMSNMVGHTRHMMPGDSIMVDGYVTQFRGLTEFSTLNNLVPIVTYLGARPIPANVPVACDIVSVTDETCLAETYESQQVLVFGVTFANGGGMFDYGDSNYVATCGAYTIQFRVDSSCNPIFGTTIPVGPVTVNAIVGQYDSSSCYCGGYQLLYGGGQTFIAGPCPNPTELTVFRTLGINTESVELRWTPGEGVPCNSYQIYYATTADADFPGAFNFLTCVSGVTSYTDVVPISTTPRRFYVVTADANCP